MRIAQDEVSKPFLGPLISEGKPNKIAPEMPGSLVIGDGKLGNKPGFTGHFYTLSGGSDPEVELGHVYWTVLIPAIYKAVTETGLSGIPYELLSRRRSLAHPDKSTANLAEYDINENPHSSPSIDDLAVKEAKLHQRGSHQ